MTLAPVTICVLLLIAATSVSGQKSLIFRAKSIFWYI